jgi:hypothetical protein
MMPSDYGLMDEDAQPCFSLGMAHRGDVADDNAKQPLLSKQSSAKTKPFESQL